MTGTKPRVVAIIQARMGSSRLPGKVMMDITGQPMLSRVYIRTARCSAVDETLVATTTDASDDPIAEYCGFSGIPCARGSQFDVLDRYYQAARQAGADVIVRITADCPVIDPALIEGVVKAVTVDQFDFACNRLPPPWGRTYPIGLDTEVVPFGNLERAVREAREPQQREHVMPFFYEGVKLASVNRRLETGVSPRGFKIALLHHTTDFGEYRWTVDTAEDLEFMRQIYSRFEDRDDFEWKEILDLVHAEPGLIEINAGVKHKTLKDIDQRGL